MREVRFRELSPREVARWAAALEETPLFAEPARRIEPLVCAFAIAFVVLALLAYGIGATFPPRELLVPVVAFGCAGAGITWLSGMALRASVSDRPRFLPGRYLHRWGYVEVDLDGLRFVPGNQLRHTVSMGPPGISGASRIVIRLSTDEGWSTSFAFVGIDLDVPRERLASLVSLLFEVDAGYRDTAVRAVEGRKRSRRLSGLTLATIVVGLLGASVPVVLHWRNFLEQQRMLEASERESSSRCVHPIARRWSES